MSELLSDRIARYKTLKKLWEHECKHNRDIPFYTKQGKPDIEFVTNIGTPIVLKWEKAEYKAYSNGKSLGYGATVPKGLIEYMKQHF